MADEETKGTPADFVYAGRMIGVKSNDAMHIVYVVKPDGTLSDNASVYDKKAFKREPIIGGVYRGAAFSDTQAFGLSKATYHTRWHDRADIVKWEARDSDAAKVLATRRLEKNTKGEVQELMLPLRRIVYKLRKRGASPEVHALSELVMQEMYRPLTKAEIEELE